jgi:hypothetical protein
MARRPRRQGAGLSDMSALRGLIVFGVAPLFFLAAAFKAGAALKAPDNRRMLLRQAVLYGLAGLVWLLVALGLLHGV